MLARLILALLLAAFALPASASAACHEARGTQAMPMAQDHATPEPLAPDHRATPPHGCIGCVPPSNWSAARLPAAPLPAALPPVARVAILDLGGASAPALRPPRRA